MPTPAEIKCVRCAYFKGVKQIPLDEGLFKFLCSAYPKGIPEDIRCWDAENPSVKERPHISIQDDQVGDFIFKEKLPEEEIDEIINYQVYDVNGMVGEFVTTSDLTNFREFIDDLEDNENIKEFINKGASLLTDGFINEVNKLKSEDEEIQATIDIFQDLVEKADTVVIINDGLKED